jgi:hypothetical protein
MIASSVPVKVALSREAEGRIAINGRSDLGSRGERDSDRYGDEQDGL